MKRFELVCFDDGSGNSSQLTCDGYTAFELVALLELKKQEIIDAIKEAAGPAKLEMEVENGAKESKYE